MAAATPPARSTVQASLARLRHMAEALACAIHSAAPLVAHLREAGKLWALTTKGKPVTNEAAITTLCDFQGSPCPLFSSPRRLLAAMGPSVAGAPAIRIASIGARPAHARLLHTASRLGWVTTEPDGAGRVDVLLLRADDATIDWRGRLEALRPALAILTHARARAAVDAGVRWSSFRFRTGATLVWDPAACDAPLWDISRPADLLLAAEARAAAAALAAGLSYAEWFGCRTLEPLQHMVRSLFVGSRKMGKSVWTTCFRNRSACFWFTGRHAHVPEHEPFSQQVLSSPELFLERLAASRAAAQRAGALPRAHPRPFLVDPAAGEGNYTEHLPDGMGRLPALSLVRQTD